MYILRGYMSHIKSLYDIVIDIVHKGERKCTMTENNNPQPETPVKKVRKPRTSKRSVRFDPDTMQDIPETPSAPEPPTVPTVTTVAEPTTTSIPVTVAPITPTVTVTVTATPTQTSTIPVFPFPGTCPIERAKFAEGIMATSANQIKMGEALVNLPTNRSYRLMLLWHARWGEKGIRGLMNEFQCPKLTPGSWRYKDAMEWFFRKHPLLERTNVRGVDIVTLPQWREMFSAMERHYGGANFLSH